jgi:ketosteroid isomerase-like protein
VAAESSEVVALQFKAFGQGLDAAAEYWHPDISWRAVEGAADDVGVMRGAKALRRYYEDWVETFDELSAEVVEVMFDSGELCAVVVNNSGRPHGSDAVVRGQYFVVCTVRDGLIAGGREYATRDEALGALGSLRRE